MAGLIGARHKEARNDMIDSTRHAARGYSAPAAHIPELRLTQPGPVYYVDDIVSLSIERTGSPDWEPEEPGTISALDSLSSMERMVIILHVWGERPVKLIATCLEISEDAVCDLYRSGLRRMRDILQERERMRERGTWGAG